MKCEQNWNISNEAKHSLMQEKQVTVICNKSNILINAIQT